jgi:hypothetical protein
MRAKVLIGTTILLVSLTQGSQASQPAVQDILAKVSETYQHLQSCRFVAHSETELAVSREETSVTIASQEQPVPSPNWAAGDSVTSQIELTVVSPSRSD